MTDRGLFHLIGALSPYGKLGVTAIANSPADAEALYARTLHVLTAEPRYRGWIPESAPPASGPGARRDARN
jgi:hypothetical protein